MLNILSRLRLHNLITDGDYYFAVLIADKQRQFGYPERIRNLAVLLAALCSHNYQQGNTCLYLDKHAEDNLFGLNYRPSDDEHDYSAEIKRKIDNLPAAEWQQALRHHIAFSDRPLTKNAPLVFQHNALYFYRVWQDEFRVAEYLKSAVENSRVFAYHLAREKVKNVLARYFPGTGESTDWQQVAVAVALRQQFCLITGGPGTGKTYTIARLLAAVQELRLSAGEKPLRIALTAPTGKAAARLTESIGNALSAMALPAELTRLIPTASVTLHRLLGVRLFEETPQFNAQNPLPADLVVADEASMIDLAMMAKLLQALRPQARLILLGDKDQLASVEAGAIIGELGQFIGQGYSPDLAAYLAEVTGQHLTPEKTGNPIRDHLCYLYESRRFGQHSGIGSLAQAVNRADANLSWRLFEQYEDIERIEFKDNPAADTKTIEADCLEKVLESAVENYAVFLRVAQQIIARDLPPDEESLNVIFARFNSVRFLTALRGGELGLERLNQTIAERLRQKGLLHFRHSRDWYFGKPVMISQNDGNAGLFNGDIGLYLGGSRVWFETGGGYRSVSISRVPSHEPAFAMTVHKSQGSEFEHTFLVLPMTLSPVLSRELIYTAVTRAKGRFTLFAKESVWKTAVRNPLKRQSGLGKLLLINNQA